LESLTGLRFVAAGGVLLDHTHSFFIGTAVFGPLGVEGVSFFFMLSGFVLTWSCADLSVREYARRRFARIYPIYALAVLLSFAVLALWSNAHAVQDLGGQTPLDTVRMLLLVQMWVPGNLTSGIDGPTWTLSVEAFFYLLFPLLVAWCRRLSPRSRRLLAAALILGEIALYVVFYHAAMTTMTTWLTIDLPPLRTIEFLLGVVAALEVRDGTRLPLSAALVLVGAAQVFEWHSALGRGFLVPFAWAPTVLPLLALLVGAASADLRAKRTLLNGRVLVRLGLWSYALYLFHYLVYATIATPGLVHWPSFVAGRLWPTIAAVTIPAIAASGIVYELVERPLERKLRGGRRRGPDSVRPAGVTPRQGIPS
jgi:peptidoglycan/LPS O-acetylase OafA/YrhL